MLRRLLLDASINRDHANMKLTSVDAVEALLREVGTPEKASPDDFFTGCSNGEFKFIFSSRYINEKSHPWFMAPISKERLLEVLSKCDPWSIKGLVNCGFISQKEASKYGTRISDAVFVATRREEVAQSA